MKQIKDWMRVHYWYKGLGIHPLWAIIYYTSTRTPPSLYPNKNKFNTYLDSNDLHPLSSIAINPIILIYQSSKPLFVLAGAPFTSAPSGPVTSIAFFFPFLSVSTLNSTRSFSASERNPSTLILVWWTKISPDSSSGTMKPYPFAVSNLGYELIIRILCQKTDQWTEYWIDHAK